ADALRVARAATAAGGLAAAAGALTRGRSRALLDGAAALLLNAGSVATRYGVFEAGMATARDPAYTVVPQRARLNARDEGQPATRTGPTSASRSSARSRTES
ncbi:polysulfide reductase, partial [Pseudonocardia benzenivorans]